MDRDMKVDPSIAEQAAEWWARLHDEGASTEDQLDFGAWVARSPERIEAYLEVARLMRALRSGRVKWPDTSADHLISAARASSSEPLLLRNHFPPKRAPTESPSASTPSGSSTEGKFEFPWHRRSIWAAAAGLMLALGFTWLWLAMPQEYATKFGEQRSILLGDGSLVTLNTGSRIEVEFHKHRRIVRLVEGEALFKLEHDPARPFDVLARNSVLRAIGTEFDVDLSEKEATVTVVEGRVAIMRESQSRVPAGWLRDSADFKSITDRAIARRLVNEEFPAPPGSLILVAAQRVVITDSGPSAPEHVADVAAATAWVQHQLVFDHEPLAQVAEQFNRYNHEQIVIQGADLSRKEVTGVFQADDPSSFLSFLSGIQGVTVQERSDGTYLVTAAGEVGDREK